jgi:hypothetical protein
MPARDRSPERKELDRCSRQLRSASAKGRSLQKAPAKPKGKPLSREDCKYGAAWMDHCCKTVLAWQARQKAEKDKKTRKKVTPPGSKAKKPRKSRKRPLVASSNNLPLSVPTSPVSSASSAPSIASTSPSPSVVYERCSSASRGELAVCFSLWASW